MGKNLNLGLKLWRFCINVRFERLSNHCWDRLGRIAPFWSWDQWLTRTVFVWVMPDRSQFFCWSYRTVRSFFVGHTGPWRMLSFLDGRIQDPWSDTSSVTWVRLKTPLCSFDLIFVSGVSDLAACPSVKFSSRIVWVIAMPKCQILCSSIVWSFSATWIWKRWFSDTDAGYLPVTYSLVVVMWDQPD